MQSAESRQCTGPVWGHLKTCSVWNEWCLSTFIFWTSFIWPIGLITLMLRNHFGFWINDLNLIDYIIYKLPQYRFTWNCHCCLFGNNNNIDALCIQFIALIWIISHVDLLFVVSYPIHTLYYVNPLTPTVAIWVQLYSILYQTVCNL